MSKIGEPGELTGRRGHKVRPPRRRGLYYGAAVLALAVGALVAYGLAGSRAAAAEVKLGAPAPDLTFTTIDGKVHRLAEFRGRPAMLWLFATWCPSCQTGTSAVAGHLVELQRAGLQIIQLELYQDLGYPGPSIQDFARAYVRPGQESPAWLWGNASKALSYTYDPRGYPDIYFLIDRQGIVRGISGGPGDAIAQILAFARAAR
jgi:thiol-disulfide isomerase/thioredoxin